MVADAPEAISRGFAQAGLAAADDRPDLVIASAQAAATAAATHPSAIVIVGRGGRCALRGLTPAVRSFVALPDPLAPHIIVPTDRRRVASYAIRTWASSESRARRLRNAAAVTAMGGRVFPDISRSLTLGIARQAPPFLVASAARFGVPANADWFLNLGLGNVLKRGVFQLFAPGEGEPGWVVKFARVAGHTDPFADDERGLALAVSAGGEVARRAPRLLGRFEVAGLPACAEEAAVGQPLTYLLQTPGHRAQKLRAVDGVADWVIGMARRTAASPAALGPERHRLATEVLPRWQGPGVPADLVARVPSVPAVLQHNDLGCWNLVTGPAGFTATDWEFARPSGFPLWDLLYFLVDALVHLDGAWAPERREVYAARLLRGELPSSAVLFRWVRAAVDSLAIPQAAIGPIVTLGWLSHHFSMLDREARAAAVAPGSREPGTYSDWMPRVWLREPGLGSEWTAWAT